ncbi:MAG: hypothetical protein M3239_07395 [Thermoproteota archaeon]|jgi:hypothetical protein|nr:hypothetical protein [Thermoproteota archaeon]
MIDTIRAIASSASAIRNESASEKKKKDKITSSKLITPCNFAKDYSQGVRR